VPYKKINNFLSADITEAKNCVPITSTIILANYDYSFEVGDLILVGQTQGGVIRYFSLEITDIVYENGTTVLTCENLIRQIFDCMIPDSAERSGEITSIITDVVEEANDKGFTDIYINLRNITATTLNYSKVNVAYRKLGELFQDLLQDTNLLMYVGYDEIEDKPNALFIHEEASLGASDLVLKSGVNIISESIKKGSIDTVRNYIILFYYPDKYPLDESWTEEVQQYKILKATGNKHLGDVSLTGDVVIKNDKAFAYMTADLEIGETRMYVNSTTDFDASGMIVINGGVYNYTGKGVNYFDLESVLTAKIYAQNSFVYPYEYSVYPNEPPVAWIMTPIYLEAGQIITHIDLECWGESAGAEIIARLHEEGTWKILYKSGALTSSNGYSEDVNWLIEKTGLYYLHFSSDKVAIATPFYPGMGPCASATGQPRDGEFQWWVEIGTPNKENYGMTDYTIYNSSFGIDHTDPSNQLAVEILVKLSESASLWSNGYSGNRYKRLLDGSIISIAQEGIDSLRIISGTNTLSDLSIASMTYTRIHFWYRGKGFTLKIKDDVDNYYYLAFSDSTVWIEKTLKISTEFTKIGNPQVFQSIDIVTTGEVYVDALYFLAEQTGTLYIASDATSIGKYHQRPEVIYAKGVADSSMAKSLADAMLEDKKEPKLSGRIKTADKLLEYIPGKEVRVIIPEKSIDDLMVICSVTHYSNGICELEVGSEEFDLKKAFANIHSDLENIKTSIGVMQQPEVGTNSFAYSPHGIKHQNNGDDEININELSGVLAENQKSEWSLITNKPTSPIVDIDDAVSKKHSHANKAQLDLVTDGDHDVRTDNPHATDDTNLVVSDVVNNNVSISKHGFMPKVPNDLTKIFKGNGTWSTLIRRELYNMLRGTTRFVYYPLITYDKIEIYVSGTGACPQEFDMARVYTGATAGSCARQNINSQTINFLNSGSWGNFYVYTSSLTADSLAFIGSAANKFTEAQNSRTYIGHHAGFFYEDGQWYISCGNGTAQTISPVTISASSHGFEIRRTGSGLEFYVDKVLVGTLTTNLPSSVGYQQWFVHNKASTNNSILYFYGFIFGAVMTS
jgi:hypothetical protein